MPRHKKHIANLKKAVDSKSLEDFMWALCGTYVQEKIDGEEQTIDSKDLHNYGKLIHTLQEGKRSSENETKGNAVSISHEEKELREALSRAQAYRVDKKL
jgi:hypothetical protein